MKKIVFLLSLGFVVLSSNASAGHDQSCVSWGHTIQPGERVCYRSSRLQYWCPRYQSYSEIGVLKRIQKLTGASAVNSNHCDHIDEHNSSPDSN